MAKKLLPLILLVLFYTGLQAQEAKRLKKLKEAAAYRMNSRARLQQNAHIQTISYSVGSIPYNSYPFAGDTVLSGADDLWSPLVPIGFNFCYYGQSYDSLLIGANGQVTFDTAEQGNYDSWAITSAIPNTVDMPPATICAAFKDIDPSWGGNILYQTTGTAPNRVMTISWVNIPLFDVSAACPGASPATFQVALYESSNVIETYIQSMDSCTGWNGGYGIIGIQDQSATVATCPPNRNYPNKWSATNEAWQFIPSSNICHPSCGAIPNSLCFVSADAALQNEIFFKHPPGPGITGTIVYRLNAQSNWDSIGYVPVSQPDVFVDPTAIPNQQAYSYCIASTDSCNNVSFKSAPHTTIFLQSNLGTGGSINLTWTAYSGLSVSTYYIYRGAAPTSMTLLNQVNAATTSFTDLNPLAGSNYYQIGIDAPPCNSNANPDTLIVSNYKVEAPNGIANNVHDAGCAIYPSPTSGLLYIRATVEIEEVVVKDLLGNQVLKLQPNGHETELRLERKGMSLIEVKTAEAIIIRRVVVE